MADVPDELQRPQFGLGPVGVQADDLECDMHTAGCLGLPHFPEPPLAELPEDSVAGDGFTAGNQVKGHVNLRRRHRRNPAASPSTGSSLNQGVKEAPPRADDRWEIIITL